MKKTYIGFIEHNDWEGEDFGYYIENTPENIELLKNVEQKYTELFVDDENPWDNEMEFDYTPYTKNELNLIAKGAGNSYIGRCNILGDNYKEKLTKYINDQCEKEDEMFPIHKGRFQLKDGSYIDLLDD